MADFISDDDMMKLEAENDFISDHDMEKLAAAPETSMYEQAKKGFEDYVVDQLPELGGAAGGLAGGFAGAPLGGVGSIPGGLAGAGAGAYLGKAAQNTYNSYMRPELAPKDTQDILIDPLKSGLQGVSDEAMGMGLGAGLGKGLGAVGRKVSEMPAAGRAKDAINRGAAKVSSFLSGADDEAALRQIERPWQTAAAEADGFSYNVGGQAKQQIEQLGDELGRLSGEARDNLVINRGNTLLDGPNEIANSTAEFLHKNKPSKAGFSALTEDEANSLKAIKDSIDSGNAEDLVKFREMIDQKVSHLYGKEGAATPYQRQLMKMRGEADKLIDQFDPDLNIANTNYSNYLNDKNVLGLNRDATVETITDNLYGGANKTAKKQAAERLIDPSLIDQMKDIGANKSFSAANRPGGENYFKRGALGVLSGGTSELLTNPEINKQALRSFGGAQNTILDLIKKDPRALGKYARPIQAAISRGGHALAVTHYLLQQQDPEYHEMARKLEGNETEK